MRWLANLFALRANEPLGVRGEKATVRFLKRKGYKIVARNSRNKLGEIDIIAVDGRTVVFVEVKSWRAEDEESPAAAVDVAKQARIVRSSLAYLKTHGLLENAVRFDVVAVQWANSEKRPHIKHIENAFEPAGFGQMFS